VTHGSDADKTPEEIEREMHQTRDSITEKVSLLESQVVGNINSVTTAADAVKEAVTDTVQAVKSAVSTAPGAVSDTVKQTFAAVKDSVRDGVNSVNVTGCIRDNPMAALGTSTVAGFLAGFFLGGRSSRLLSGYDPSGPRRHASAGGPTRAPERLDASGDSTPFGLHASHGAGGGQGLLGGMFGGVFGGLIESATKEIRQIAEEALSTALASLKQNVRTQVPHLIDNAMSQVSERVAGAVGGDGNGTATRVGGPNYSAQPPSGRL